jgi:hypothetical protein
MKKIKITIQRTLFNQNDIINESNRTYSFEIECDSYKENRDEIEITKENLDYAKKFINENYKLGDIHKSPLKSISFIKNNEIIKNVEVLADPYYKLEEFINGKYIVVDKHNCNNH